MNNIDSMPPLQQLELAEEMHAHMLSSMNTINGQHPSKPSHKAPEWSSHVKSLLRLARRNPKMFFRRAKADGLIPMRNPCPPMDPAFLKRLVQETLPFDPTVIDVMPSPESSIPNLPIPTDDQLFHHARVPRAKSPGPDGIPPYLVYLLPPRLFHLSANCIRLSLSLQSPLPRFFDASLIGLFKPKKDWWAPNAWRPIAMSTAYYRIGMRFVKTHLSPHVERLLSPGQYGGRSGHSPGMATHHLLAKMESHSLLNPCTHLVLLDV